MFALTALLCQVCKTKLSPDMSIAGRPLGSASKFLCIKADAILDSSPEKVFDLQFHVVLSD